MSKASWIGVATGLVVASGLVVYLYRAQHPAAPEAPASPAAVVPAPAPEPPAVSAEPDVRYPLAETEAESADAVPLPELGASDADFQAALEELFGPRPVESFLVPGHVVRNLVATINSLSGDPVPLRVRSLRNVQGPFKVVQDGASLTIAADNARRYAPLVSLLQATDAARIAAVYRRYYPLMQKAYAEQGYPRRYFNDRVIEVIDHLLATPEVEGPILLVRPKVLYLYADESLEERSSGQKLLIRLGADHAAVVKQKLRELRDLIAVNGAR